MFNLFLLFLILIYHQRTNKQHFDKLNNKINTNKYHPTNLN